MSLGRRPARLEHIAGIGVDRVGATADATARDLLRLENLDVDIPPDETAIARTKEAVSPASVMVPVGIVQDAAATALEQSYETLPAYVTELLPATGFGIDGATLSERLLEHGVAATPMTGWGETHAGQSIRFVFANEPADRLALLGERLRAALRL